MSEHEPPSSRPPWSEHRYTAFTELYADFQEPLLRVVRRRAPSADHEAAVSEAFKALWQEWDRLTGERRAWVTRVAINAAYTQLRRQMREQELLQYGAGIPVGHLDTPEDRLAQIAFFRALPQLPRSLGATMLLRYLEGRTPAQIAADRGTSIPTVVQELSRARRVLRGILMSTSDEPTAQPRRPLPPGERKP